jgi:hypothetical protein
MCQEKPATSYNNLLGMILSDTGFCPSSFIIGASNSRYLGHYLTWLTIPQNSITMVSFEEDGRYVGTVRVVVHTRGPRSHKGVNHWSIYLILANGEGSVRINMRSKVEDPTGIFEMTSHTYTDCHSRIEFWDFPVNGSVPVASFYGLVYALGRHRYLMTQDDSGCRWWV